MAKINRQERTKYKLAASVKECMKTQPVDKVTAKSIVEGCGVTRQAFYHSFLGKYDLINWYLDKPVPQSFEQIDMGHTVGENLTRKLEFIFNEKMFFTEAFRSDDENSLKEHDLEPILKFHTDPLIRKDSKALNQELQFLLGMYCQSSVYIIARWVLGGMKGSSQDMSGKLAEVMPSKPAEILERLKLLQVIVDNENS